MSKKEIPSSGDPVIDEGHQELSQQVEEIAQLWRLGAETSVLGERLADFRARAVRHFDEEKTILANKDADAQRRHASQNEDVIRKIDAVLADFTDGNGAVRWFDMIDSIENMLLHHKIALDTGSSAMLGKGEQEPHEPLIVWTHDLALGIDWIDQHHRVLIDTINEIAQLPEAYDLGDADALLERLRRITWHHFHEEEARLALVNPGAAQRHVAQHRQLLGELDRLIFDVRSRRVVLSESTSDTLVKWLVEHIVNCDKRDFNVPSR
jgi:hemerythrin-like metal-binding protein